MNIYSELGGGSNGYLGLGLTVAKYISVLVIAYARLVYQVQVASVGAT